mmetsp:Transcript_59682/g.106469  ORF Transcript_59682/g.106469 Transcript_59682/m.106469 type:complete len:80 (-) Transcript_59682:894-1133(-)
MEIVVYSADALQEQQEQQEQQGDEDQQEDIAALSVAELEAITEAEKSFVVIKEDDYSGRGELFGLKSFHWVINYQPNLD